MLELLSPAGSPEAVVAAVQNGADAVYMGLGIFNARRGAKNFSDEEFEKAVRYCRIRDCKVYVTMNTLIGDREAERATELARRVSALGADAILVQDLGLLSILKKAVPDIPLHASTQMSIHNLAGVEAAAEMGLTRAVLARELSLEQIKFITKHSPIETEIFVHGALCFCHSGQCYMSSLIGRRSGNRGMCAQPCRMEYSMGGRLEDSHPLSLKDNCLVDRLREIEDAGVACVKIEGRMKRPEYTGIVTGIYSKVIKEHREPTEDEMQTLTDAFSRQGFTQGYFNGDKTDMFGVRAESDKIDEKLYAEARREYMGREERRVPVKFYALVNAGEAVKAAAMDNCGNKVVAFGAEPKKAIRQAISSEVMSERLAKTGGTPYYCEDVRSRVQNGLFLSASEINELRRKLVTALNERRAQPPARRSLPMPPMPTGQSAVTDPVMIYQVRTEEQLTEELAETKPDYIYIPVKLMYDRFDLAQLFIDQGAIPVAVLPRVITDDEVNKLFSMLRELFDRGINEALVGNIGHIKLARKAGMKTRADFGMNVFNSYSMEMLQQMGFMSATASFELRLAQVRDMAKCVPTELIVYGRLPLMVSDQCVISHSLGSCSCRTPAQLSDRMGSTFPVVREYDHRNVIYNSRKLFMADKNDELCGIGLWGIRLMFTTEGARECVQVAKRYKGEGDYQPNDLTRGLYYRGVD
jgi:U32 family peptidase